MSSNNSKELCDVLRREVFSETGISVKMGLSDTRLLYIIINSMMSRHRELDHVERCSTIFYPSRNLFETSIFLSHEFSTYRKGQISVFAIKARKRIYRGHQLCSTDLLFSWLPGFLVEHYGKIGEKQI